MRALALDLGNTAAKAGWFEGRQLQHTARREGGGAADFGAWLSAELAARPVDGLVVSSVVPAWDAQLQAAAGSTPLLRVGRDPLQTATRLHPSVQGLGSDRWMAAEAAFALGGGPVIAVAAGTATTFTVVDAQGEIRGGAIAPGLGLGAAALARAGAQLFEVPLEVPRSALGADTRTAMQSGLVFGHAALIDGMLRRLQQEWGSPLRAVGTGGWMELLQPLLAHPLERDPELILRGLALVGERSWSAQGPGAPKAR